MTKTIELWLSFGSSSSPIIADIPTQQFETTSINSLNFNIPRYIRYVDDILLFIPQNKIDITFKIFNFFHDRSKFTTESPQQNNINFLILIIINIFLIGTRDLPDQADITIFSLLPLTRNL